jgi:hypothetical protein
MRVHPISIEGNLHFVRQGIALLEHLDEDSYTRGRQGWAPVGAQFRHVLDHYRCFFLGLTDGRINYDARLREIEVELKPERAMAVAQGIVRALAEIDAAAAQRPVQVHLNSGGGDEELDWHASTVGRELQFLSSHTVHHYALIKLLLQGSVVEAGEEFGVAPSTLAYLRSGR